jgi:hypothetical protein
VLLDRRFEGRNGALGVALLDEGEPEPAEDDRPTASSEDAPFGRLSA